jgi:leader peptidase (prepilin peptidase)/N-methyltransferase
MLAILTYKFLLIDYFSIFASSSIIWTGILLALFYAFIFILLFVVLLYDLKHKIVPIQFSLLIILVGISFEAYRVYNYLAIYSEFSTLFWLDLFSGFLISLPFLIIFLLSRGKAVGFGDIMLLFGVGYITGFIFGVSTFLLSIWIGAIVSLIMLYLFPKKYNRKSEIPFAPFIVIATVLMIFLEIDFIGLSMFLY